MREKINVISECKREKEYINLPVDIQDELFYELMAIKANKT